MEFDFESIKGKVSELAQSGAALAQTGMAKAKEVADITKLKVANAAEESNIRKAYIELGKLYYAEFSANPGEAYAPHCEAIAAAKEKIAYNNEKIEDIKAAGNIQDADVADIVDEVPAEEPEAPEDPQPPEE